jgi:threonine dehydratase
MITPQEKYSKLAEKIDIKQDIYLKREDLHPYGSHKGRSIPLMIDMYIANGDRDFVISSSGNAALSAVIHIDKLNKEHSEKITLTVFVGQNVNKEKLAKLQKYTSENIQIFQKERPLQALTQAVQEGKRSLRQSTDNIALLGYESLAKELSTIKNLCAVFIGTSSGTTAEALCKYFIENNLPTQVHIVQTSSCHPIFDAFENYDGPDEVSLADAIVDQTAMRKNRLVELINKTGGYAWCANNNDITNAQKITLDATDIKISTNSALSIAGLMLANYRGWDFAGPIACIICGD